MGLTSEQVHWIFGAALVIGALLLLMRALGRVAGRWVDFVVPGLLGLFGAELLLDPLVHGSAVPGNYGKETAQHYALGGVLIATAAAEFVRIIRRHEGRLWRVPLVAALLIASGVFLVHAQHDANVSMLLLMTQHRVIGATLMVAALAVILAPSEERADPKRSQAFALVILILGAQFLIYTEGNSIFGFAAPEGSSRMVH